MSSKWQIELADSFTRPQDLLAFLELSMEEFPDIQNGTSIFPFRVTRSYANRITKKNPQDPLLKQIWPTLDEFMVHPDFTVDPVGDVDSVIVPGLLQKYSGRALVLTTASCPIHCRYCFRRAFPYSSQQVGKRREQVILREIAEHTDIQEIILSGGDPFMLSDERIASWVQMLSTIPHIKRLRFHTRVPIALPSRITSELIEVLTVSRLKMVVVIHTNHPSELDASVQNALNRLHQGDITLFNQSVLLRGINDDSETLIALSEKLFGNRVLPYYLHLLDKAEGTTHFEIPEEEARQLLSALQKNLPGYLVPKLVREVKGITSKQLIS